MQFKEQTKPNTQFQEHRYLSKQKTKTKLNTATVENLEFKIMSPFGRWALSSEAFTMHTPSEIGNTEKRCDEQGEHRNVLG
jgi:hypothetical protein